MGSRMAENLIDSGYELIVHNRSKEKAARLLQKGAKWADSPKEVAQQSDVILTMLANPRAVETVALGEHGFLPTSLKGAFGSIAVQSIRPLLEKWRKNPRSGAFAF